MCGIIGVLNRNNAGEKARKCLSRIIYRGIDGTDFYEEDKLCFGHALHSVVGNMPQPLIKGDFIFGANCEIYNWKDLAKKHSMDSKNDAELLLDLLILFLKDKKIKDINEKTLNDALRELDGVFAFFIYNRRNKYTLIARDIIGEKPLWFYMSGKSMVFASEKKAIEDENTAPEELNPRKIILYDNQKNILQLLNQHFFEITSSAEEIDINSAKKKLKALLEKSVDKRMPDRKMGLLFSGGIDSTLLAFMLKKRDIDFTAYMTVSDKKTDEIKNAKRIAQLLDFDLKIVEVNKDLVRKELPNVISLIESSDPVKVEVGMVMYLALKKAKEGGIKVIFSGVGADDIFWGYKRMRMYKGINEDTLSSLRRIYERDLYRDDVLSMANNIELRLPYLDKQLIRSILRIPDNYKYSETPKLLLREIAVELGLPKELSSLKRNAAQYSSGISKILSQIVKEQNESFKGKLLLDIYGRKNLKLGVLFSSGKDCIYAMHIQNRLNYEITCLISIESENKDSFMFHTPTISITKYQSKALGIPLLMHKTDGAKEKELEDLKAAISKAKERYGIQGVISGAIYSNYQRKRIEKICDELNLKVYSPLWHMDQEIEMRNLINGGYEFIITKVAADGLDKSWLGKRVTIEDLEKLIVLNKKNNINITGEGGEFESLVLDAPMFKERLKIVLYNIKEESKNCAELIVEEIEFEKKN